MKIIRDVPEAIYNAICDLNSKPPQKDAMRVTELCDSPQIKRLKIAHWDEITVPASSFLWALTGTMMHNLVSGYGQNNALAEERLVSFSGPVPLYGTPDRYADRIIEDYKFTSVWSFLNPKAEWTGQLNCYAQLFTENGFPVDALRIQSILKDWSPSTALRDPEYPRSAFKTHEIPLWTERERRSYIADRFTQHLNRTTCTDEERWKRPSAYAVMKEGRKSAVRVLDSLEDAEKYMQDNKLDKKHSIAERPGAYVRCEAYCTAAPFCEQWKNTPKKERTTIE